MHFIPPIHLDDDDENYDRESNIELGEKGFGRYLSIILITKRIVIRNQ